jgi:hypothetical protein
MALREITLDQFAQMQIDDTDGRLFWKGQPVVTRQELGLEGATFVLAALATAATLVAAVWPIAVHLHWFGL